jgi:hypothetical protein
MRPYVVRQGDYLELLASRFGFDADAVWEHDCNRELRASRCSPNVLAPGDILHIPDEPARPLTLTLGTTNRYRASLRRVPIRLRIELGDQVLSNERCLVTGTTPAINKLTDADGMLSFEIAPHVHEVRIEVVRRRLSFRVLVGHLDPHSQESGAFERLLNLGYLAPEGRIASGAARADRLRRALAAFQRDQGMDPTGKLDAATQDALQNVHRR